MSVIIDGGAGITFPDTVQQTNALTNTGGPPRYYAARAWVTFDGSTSPPTILSASNIASVSRISTGVFRLTFTTNMPNANYAVVGTGRSSNIGRVLIVSLEDTFTPTVSTFGIEMCNLSASAGSPNTSLDDSERVSVVVFA